MPPPPPCRPRHPQTPLPLLFFGGGDETLEDGSRYNPQVISFIRDEWIHAQMQARCVPDRRGLSSRVGTGTGAGALHGAAAACALVPPAARRPPV